MTESKKSANTLRHLFTADDFYRFGIDWQTATGKILLTKERTRPAGEAKLKDAEERQKELDALLKERSKCKD